MIENDALAAARCGSALEPDEAARASFCSPSHGVVRNVAVVVDGRVLRGPGGRPPEFGPSSSIDRD